MKNFNILNNIDKELELKSYFELIMEKNKIETRKNITILEFCGQGSYGIVYKCIIDNRICAIKLSKNEKSDILYKRYYSLKDKLDDKMIKIYYFGKNINNKNYKYYCIQEYGGVNLKEYLKKKDISIIIIKNIIKQLCDIVESIKSNKLFLPDFKLSNLLIDENNIIKIIDIYMECDNYEPCKKCSTVRTYNVIEISKNLYEDDKYNYSYILTLFGFSLINMLCKKSLSTCCTILSDKYKLEDDIKYMTLLLQYGCYTFFNEKNNPFIVYTCHLVDYNIKFL